ncbi:hypothetical protein NMY3_03197 [Candidatus Nitrosocosmicus oleophilus]|uniref:Uncharacterized protein n=1 Tax=Candidatus Nitrosocosmicus oleophilus TaxID=1353260 RepID=A0A654MD26_9ARCH|nr:hypothetical protein NMY3_03197 [Candidatus Nitrosocosmicus oleophilus]
MDSVLAAYKHLNQLQLVTSILRLKQLFYIMRTLEFTKNNYPIERNQSLAYLAPWSNKFLHKKCNNLKMPQIQITLPMKFTVTKELVMLWQIQQEQDSY